MTIKSFIEAAIEGGWGVPFMKGNIKRGYSLENISIGSGHSHILIRLQDPENKLMAANPIGYVLHEILLDPQAWIAVVRVQQKREIETGYEVSQQFISDVAQARMHAMIDALFMGKTLEEHLATL